MNRELYHHGVKGQKWGITNGPPYPLDSSVSDGKSIKKAQSNVRKLVKKKYKNHEEAVADVANKLKNQTRSEDIKTIIDKKKKWYNSDAPDFFESKEYETAKKEAYSETVKWFEKNEPEKLSKWSKETDDFRDFRYFDTAYDGFLDELSDKYEKQFNSKNKTTQAKLFNDYIEASKLYVDKLIGEQNFSLIGYYKRANSDTPDREVKYTQSNLASVQTVHNIVSDAVDKLGEEMDPDYWSQFNKKE